MSEKGEGKGVIRKEGRKREAKGGSKNEEEIGIRKGGKEIREREGRA